MAHAREGDIVRAAHPGRGPNRRFLLLQGPHGPFFSQLARHLRDAGAQVRRVGFNAGDAAFWHGPGFVRFDAPQEAWPAFADDLMSREGTTDLVLYGDVRPVHAEAIRLAEARGIRVHVFEEGYMRPYWVTYERGGSNGRSRLMTTSIADMRAALAASGMEGPETPGHWGDTRQHVFWGAAYHGAVLLGARRWPAFRPHRTIGIGQEAMLHARRLGGMPAAAALRRGVTARIQRGGWPFHLVLLQLAHDASLTAHSDFSSPRDFADTVVRGFAEGAPPHHRLVFKAHPLEDGRARPRDAVRAAARRHGVEGRVHYVPGGKLARLLDDARSAVTVNSTAGQQVLWRGLPLKTFGAAVYDKPEFVSPQPLPDFFARPGRPDSRAYKDYRRYLLETSQVAGGFYSARGRRQLLRQVVDMVLAPENPYDALSSGRASPRQQLRVVR
ncbi:capsular polysaccharide export protein [Hasllibacter halocynthiae]|uniref:Capsular polysaccharide export protein n=1 Tax=Hasllibacter halocynthiae TaxID=595589 RepID=A0A2T0X6Z5_9RHOB|nr:capsule biosynthesis protein CapA [Hasllibacter halocynthiae]PRY94731.1 capsular polysaccharide export protein [Hasllibacter halocynthiae]